MSSFRRSFRFCRSVRTSTYLNPSGELGNVNEATQWVIAFAATGTAAPRLVAATAVRRYRSVRREYRSIAQSVSSSGSYARARRLRDKTREDAGLSATLATIFLGTVEVLIFLYAFRLLIRSEFRRVQVGARCPAFAASGAVELFRRCFREFTHGLEICDRRFVS